MPNLFALDPSCRLYVRPSYSQAFSLSHMRPFPSVATLSDEEVNKFADHLLIETELITSCIACRPFFQRAITKYNGFSVAKPSPANLVGLGAVRYNPLEAMFKVGPNAKQGQRISELVDELNKAIVIKLNNDKHHVRNRFKSHCSLLTHISPQIFYTSKTEEGQVCIALHVDISPLNRYRAYSLAFLLHQTAVAIETETKARPSPSLSALNLTIISR